MGGKKFIFGVLFLTFYLARTTVNSGDERQTPNLVHSTLTHLQSLLLPLSSLFSSLSYLSQT